MGANDGIVSTASLILGVAAAQATSHSILIAGVAGLVAGTMSITPGEYVSVSSQADTEKANLARERREIETEPAAELAELTAIYVKRGLDLSLAKQVVEQLTAHGALAAHSRDELGASELLVVRPVQAALASAGTFAVGAALPLWAVLVAPGAHLIHLVAGASLIFLAILGGVAAFVGGASATRGAIRVTWHSRWE